MTRKQCELLWCASNYNDENLVYVHENIGDASFRTPICSTCANKLHLVEGMDLPTADEVKFKLTGHHLSKKEILK